MKKKNKEQQFKYPGKRVAVDGNTAVIMCERESSDAAGAYPITPSTQMGEFWAEAAAAGHLNIAGRPLIFIEPEGEHAAAAVTAGLAMTGLRAINFSSGQGIAYMHESLYAAVGKRLTYVLNIGARAMTKANLNVHAGHDDYHCIDDTGFFQLFARDAQSVADLNIISHRIAELSLTPGAIAQDGFLTTHLIESILIPERELIAEYLGQADDVIETPTPAQKIIYGPKRRRIPELWDVDNPVMAGLVQNQDAYMQSVASQRPFFFDHLNELSAQAFDEFYKLTGRRYDRVKTYKAEEADYLILAQGSVVSSAEAVADYLFETRGLKVGVVDLVMFRPFPADMLGKILKGKKAVTILERLDQPLAVDLPVMREVRAALSRCLENGRDPDQKPFPELEVYTKASDAPALYSGSFGMGSRDLQPEGIIGAVENMLPDGPKKTFYYLSIDFLKDEPATPKMALHQETIGEAYPNVQDLALKGSENPNLMPEGAITVRFHSVGGWGAITTGKNLAMTLYDLLGYHIKANPKYGSEKKGQPTTYYLSAAPDPIRINCEYFYVDVVLSPDPNVFEHTNALAGLKEGGVLIMQGDQETPEELWTSLSPYYRKIIVDKEIKLFYLDAFKIAREEASDPDLQLRMQGIAFQGAFFAATPVAKQAGLSEEKLLDAIHAQIQDKFGKKGARIVEENIRVVKRGYDLVQEVPYGSLTEEKAGDAGANSEPPLPEMLKILPKSKSPTTDIHRFWEQTGSFYARGMGTDSITDPFIGLGTMPAVTALFRDMTGIRFNHPEWVSENCTACGNCYTVCPDTAIPGLVSEVGAVFETVVKRLRKNGKELAHLPKAVRVLEQKVRAEFDEAKETDKVHWMIEDSINKTVQDSGLEGDEREALQDEFQMFSEELNGFQFSLTRPYYTLPEKEAKGDGGLFSITVNPTTCKGCMECIAVCDDDALISVPQTKESIDEMRQNWDFWTDLPNTPEKYSRIDDLEEGIGALETLLLQKDNYLSFTSGDGACLGCGEKTVMHIFVATVEALMQPRVKRHVEYLDELIGKMEEHFRLELVQEISAGDPATIAGLVDQMGGGEVTLANIAEKVEQISGGEPIDQEKVRHITGLLSKLKVLKWRYAEGTTGLGRSNMGILNATGCSSVWGSTYPFNPYPFPWANHLFQDPASMALGVFEGHMLKMAEGFKAIREAELVLSGEYRASEHDDFLARFNWNQFTDDEWELCPPVVAVGGDGAMYDIGFQNLSRALMSGKPLKVLVLDTQVYSNTGGQACTSGFFGQVSDMAQYGKATQGKEEIRKEMGLLGMAHRTTYVLQSSIANRNHMIEGFIQGLKARRPALFNLYTSCQPEHGIGDDKSFDQAKLAVESRAYPIFRYNPDNGIKPEDCFELGGNPAMDQDWPTYTLKYMDGHREKTMELPMTFADFAITEIRFRKHFRIAPPDTWNDSMVPLAEFLDMDEDDREGLFPFLWSIDRKQQLTRLLVAEPMVLSCEDRRNFWTMLRSLARVADGSPSPEQIEAKVRKEMTGKIAAGLIGLIDGNAGGAAAALEDIAGAPAEADGGSNGDSAGAIAPWIETEQCTSCDECININPAIFEYNADKKAVIKSNWSGPYEDLVKAAERCTARVIHPGLPADQSDKKIAKLVKRAEKYN